LAINGPTSFIGIGTGGLLGIGVDADKNAAGVGFVSLNGGAIYSDEVYVGAGGVLAGNGTIVGTLVVDGGRVGPGFSPGRLIVDDLIVMAGSTLEIEIYGFSPGEFDVIEILNSADFMGGNILLSFGGGYVPEAGAAFEIFEAAFPIDFPDVTFETEGLGSFEFEVVASDNGYEVTTVSATATPEPGVLGLVFAGLFGLAWVARRR
jgi:hypothetical protein